MGYILNKAIVMGRCTRDAELRVTAGDNPTHIARYTVAVDRTAPKGAEREANFINCCAFGAQADTAEKYFKKGTKVFVSGEIRTGSYTKDGVRIPTFEIIVEDQGMVESKKESQPSLTGEGVSAAGSGYFIPEEIDEMFH